MFLKSLIVIMLSSYISCKTSSEKMGNRIDNDTLNFVSGALNGEKVDYQGLFLVRSKNTPDLFVQWKTYKIRGKFQKKDYNESSEIDITFPNRVLNAMDKGPMEKAKFVSFCLMLQSANVMVTNGNKVHLKGLHYSQNLELNFIREDKEQQ